ASQASAHTPVLLPAAGRTSQSSMSAKAGSADHSGSKTLRALHHSICNLLESLATALFHHSAARGTNTPSGPPFSSCNLLCPCSASLSSPAALSCPPESLRLDCSCSSARSSRQFLRAIRRVLP